MTGRRFLGRDSESSGVHIVALLFLGPLVLLMSLRRKVFLVDGALEVDEDLNYDIERRRVYFDDVLAITYHRVLGGLHVGALAFCMVVFGLAALGFWSEDELVAAGVFLGIAAVFLALAIVRLILGIDVITVYGRRTRARMKFGWAKARARRTFQELVDLVRARQSEAAQAIAPAPPPPMPPGPEPLV
jgi:hypothetical protein